MSVEEEHHRCYGCVYDSEDYLPECTGCRMKLNLYYNTPDETEHFKSLPIKYEPVEVVSYGSHRLLKRR